MVRLTDAPDRALDCPTSAGSRISPQVLRNLTAGFAMGIGQLLSAAEPPAPLAQTFRETLQGMDADTFAKREQAQEQLWHALTAQCEVQNPPPMDAPALLQDASPAFPLTPEQRRRLVGLHTQFLHHVADRPAVLAVAPVRSAAAIVGDLETLLGVPIRVQEPADVERLATTPAPLREDQRVACRALAAICNTYRLVPELREDRSFLLRPALEGDWVTASDGLLAIVRKGDDGMPSQQLFAEPGTQALIAFDQRPVEKEEHWPPPRAVHSTLTIPQPYGPEWTANSGLTKRRLTYESTDTFSRPLVIADMPQEATLVPGEQSVSIGFLDISCTTAQQGDGKWITNVRLGICQDTPWPPTPLAWDMLTYATAEATQVICINEEGQRIPTERIRLHFDRRTGQLDILSLEQPASITVRAFSRMHTVERELPPVDCIDTITQDGQMDAEK